MTVELKNDAPEVKDLVHLLNAFSKSEVVSLKIKDFAKDIRDRVLQAERDKKQLQDEIISMYKNDNYSAGKIAEIFNLEKEEVVNILADNDIYCYDYSDEELERDLNTLEKVLNK